MTIKPLTHILIEIDNHPSAEEFRQISAKVEASSKPDPGRMRVENNPEIQKKLKAMNRAIGYINGPPEDPELMPDWLEQAITYLQAQSRKRAQWPQQEAADREIQRMRKSVTLCSYEEPPNSIQRRQRVGKRAEFRLKSIKNLSQRTTRSGSPNDEPITDFAVDNTVQQSSSPIVVQQITPILLQSETLSLNENLEEVSTPKTLVDVCEIDDTTRNQAVDAARKRRQQSTDNMALASSLGSYWEPRIDEAGGRPKKRAQT
jgi:hypothetical protein